jgi:hypothetical protein
LIFTDEASFRQDSTLHATWSRVGHPPEVPVTGERKNVKILGAIELWRTRFHSREETVFNASSYLGFLEVRFWEVYAPLLGNGGERRSNEAPGAGGGS